jgi:hypothetical protein
VKFPFVNIVAQTENGATALFYVLFMGISKNMNSDNDLDCKVNLNSCNAYVRGQVDEQELPNVSVENGVVYENAEVVTAWSGSEVECFQGLGLGVAPQAFSYTKIEISHAREILKKMFPSRMETSEFGHLNALGSCSKP